MIEESKKKEKAEDLFEKIGRRLQAQRRRTKFMKPLKDWIEKQKHRRMFYLNGSWEKNFWHPEPCIELGLTVNAKLLIETHPEYINEDISGFTLLHIAAIHGNTEIAELLLLKGANINAVDYLHRTALLHAVEHYHKEMVELLLSYEAFPSIAQEDGGTPLHKAALYEIPETIEITKLLLAYGANFNAKNIDGWTPFMVAIRSDSYKIVQLLLEVELNRLNLTK
jgi:ankyrin repeat protein